MSNDLAVITTIRQGSDQDLIERTRAEVFLSTAAACVSLGLPLVAVFKDCSKIYLRKLDNLNVVLVPQSTNGMGQVRREAIKAGIDKASAARYYLWIEPEKLGLPVLASKVIVGLEQSGAEFCFFNRHRMNSYPPEQAYYYLFCRSVASALVGFDLDYAFGPMIFTKTSARFFLEYGGEYGDLWDSILIPRLRILRGHIPYIVKTVEFYNDPRMTVVECGNPKITLKRIEQLRNIIPSLMAEWQKLV